MREDHAQMLALRTAAVAAGHVDRGPRLDEKHQTLRCQIELIGELEPVLSCQPLFARHAVADKKAMKAGHQYLQADFDQRQAEFFKRDVLERFPDSQDVRPRFSTRRSRMPPS